MTETKTFYVNLMTCGIDSTLGYLYLKSKNSDVKQYHNLYVNTGSRYTTSELKKVIRIFEVFGSNYPEDEFLITHKILYEKFVQSILEFEDAYYTNRNLLLILIVSGIFYRTDQKAKIRINLFNNKDDRIDDGNIDYYKRIVDAGIVKNLESIDLPLKDMSKVELGKWFIDEYNNETMFPTKSDKIDFLVNGTWSCYSNENEECLSCKACFRKSVVLANVCNYIRPHRDKEMIQKYLDDKNMHPERKAAIELYAKFSQLGDKVNEHA